MQPEPNFAPLIFIGGTLLVMVVMGMLLARARSRRRAEFDGEEDSTKTATQLRAAAEGEPAAGFEAPSPEDDDREQAEPLEAAPSPVETPEPPLPVERSSGSADREALNRGLAKTRESFLGRINALFSGKQKVDAALLDDLEDVLLTADVGVSLTMEWLDELRAQVKAGKLTDAAGILAALKERIEAVVGRADAHDDPLLPAKVAPKVILFVGVNGVGKTTTIGKIASKLRDQGKSVVLAAGDTFRAAAAEQLTVWAERADAKLIRGDEGGDPASVIFNAVNHGKETGADFVLADTAGRLHTKSNLMDEIQKVKRAASKARDGAPDETWLVIDATTGQNGLQQANQFHETLELTGVILTKLDGTAKGGVVIAIANALGIPVRFIGVGEKASDLRPFDAKAFVAGLFGDS